jgi:3',5'-nucleoside bisphosphate phosphatase
VIDLHLHTTASDGKLRPSALVALAARANLRIISVTDHDTVAGLAEAREAASAHGLRLVNGIEVTAVEQGRDVHVLGYFLDPDNQQLAQFLQTQRADRIERLREIGARLKALGCEVDVEAIIATSAELVGRSVGRPLIADALVAQGLAIDRRDAFDRLLGNDGPAFVPRCGPPVGRVAAVIAAAGGITSLAHPILLRDDAVIPAYAASGLSAIEVRHKEHDEAAEARYREWARSLDLAVSGGSDFHGDALTDFGTLTLASGDFQALEARAMASISRPLRSQEADTSA